MRYVLMVFVVVMALLTGCAPKVDTRTIDGLIEHFKNSGLVVNAKNEKLAAMIGAGDGAGLSVYGQEVEVYKYDTSQEVQKLSLDKVVKEGTITVLGSIVLPVQVNGAFIITGYQDHPEKDKILSAFKSWGYAAENKKPESTTSKNPSTPDNLSIKELNGVWKPEGETGLFKFNFSVKPMIVSIVDGEKVANVALKVASIDKLNGVVNFQYEANPKETLTLKRLYNKGSSSKFDLSIILTDGTSTSLSFVRNIDSSDDFTIFDISKLSQFVNQDPTSVLDSNELKSRFSALLGPSLDDFKYRFGVGSNTTRVGEWLVGEGMAQHAGSIDEAAFAINLNSGNVFASMLSEGKTINFYGAATVDGLPEPLRQWCIDRGIE